MKKVVFLGNPNVGKSALINAMSKSKIKVGNWAGVTVEKLEANFTYKNEELEFIDLPGAYNFTNDHEQKITTEILLNGDYDLIVNVLDATNLERNLNITLLARELEKPMIVCLNFDDDVTKQGLVIDTVKLQRYLQMPVFKTSATKHTGLEQVLDYIVDNDFPKHIDYNIYYDKDIDATVAKIYEILKSDQIEVPSYGIKFLAYRLFERESHYTGTIPESTLEKINQVINNSKVLLQESTEEQLHVKRYEQVEKVLKDVIDKYGVSRYKITQKIDRIILNKWLGLPIFFIFAVYFLSLVFNVANPLIDWLDGFIGGFVTYHVGTWVTGLPEWTQAMILDGILGGVGGVLVFTPLMYFIYLLMAILEESGIMARIAFLMDRVMRGLGLTGRSLISLIIGFGCTVPAISSTRTLESDKARKATTMMLPFISCGARLPVYALFGAAFFSKNIGLIVASLYVLGIAVAVIVALVLKALKIYDINEDSTAFTIEIPPYRLPEARLLLKNVNNRVKGFLKRVITLIMVILFAVWALSYFPNGEQEDSYLFRATEVVRPIFAPTGFGDSKVAVAAIPTAIAAKEAVVGTIDTLTGIEEEEGEGRPEDSYLEFQGQAFLDAATSSLKAIVTLNIASIFDPAVDDLGEDSINSASTLFEGEHAKLKAYSYMTFILLLVPCAVALAAVRKEFGTRFTLEVLTVSLIVPYVVSILIYQIGRLIL